MPLCAPPPVTLNVNELKDVFEYGNCEKRDAFRGLTDEPPFVPLITIMIHDVSLDSEPKAARGLYD